MDTVFLVLDGVVQRTVAVFSTWDLANAYVISSDKRGQWQITEMRVDDPNWALRPAPPV